MDQASRSSENSYWGLVVLLGGFGFIAIASIGLPFLFVATTLAMLSPHRSRPRVFWPVLALVVGFLAGYVLVAPFSCTATSGVNPTTGITTFDTEVCRSLVGVEYGDETRTPGLITGGVVALVGATVAWVVAGRHHSGAL